MLIMWKYIYIQGKEGLRFRRIKLECNYINIGVHA